MGRYTGPKNKLSRREGKDLFGRDSASLKRRLNQVPGVHGNKRRGKVSVYGQQLREKQKVKRMYGMREEQFRRFYAKAIENKEEKTGVALLKLLERRLDSVVYKLGFARSINQGRQFITQGFVSVDGKKVTIPSYIVAPGQKVQVNEHVQSIPKVIESWSNNANIPEWLKRETEEGKGIGIVVREPQREEMDQEIKEELIVGFYSR